MPGLHRSLITRFPEQLTPRHCRLLVRIPAPQVTEHLLHRPQGDHLPFDALSTTAEMTTYQLYHVRNVMSYCIKMSLKSVAWQYGTSQIPVSWDDYSHVFFNELIWIWLEVCEIWNNWWIGGEPPCHSKSHQIYGSGVEFKIPRHFAPGQACSLHEIVTTFGPEQKLLRHFRVLLRVPPAHVTEHSPQSLHGPKFP